MGILAVMLLGGLYFTSIEKRNGGMSRNETKNIEQAKKSPPKESGGEREYRIIAQKVIPIAEVGERYIVPNLDNIEELKGPDIGYYYLYDKKKHIMNAYAPGVPKATPKIEFRFRRARGNGQLVPCRVTGMAFSPVINGKKRFTRENELGAVDFHYPTYGWRGAYGLRTLLFDGPGQGHAAIQGLFLGETYLMDIGYVVGDDYHDRDKGERLITVPENVPPGKMVVMEIDVTQIDKGWRKKDTETDVHRLTIKVSEELMHSERMKILMTEPGKERTQPAEVNDKGIARKRVEKLGGDLALVQIKGPSSRPHYEHVLCYVPRISETEITLPRDARLVVEEDNVVRFRLRVPWDRMADETVYIALCASEKSHVWLTFARLAEKPATVSLAFVPGTYIVKEVAQWPTRAIGRVTVTEADEGKILEVQPFDN
jgi:hypothetical protein